MINKINRSCRVSQLFKEKWSAIVWVLDRPCSLALRRKVTDISHLSSWKCPSVKFQYHAYFGSFLQFSNMLIKILNLILFFGDVYYGL